MKFRNQEYYRKVKASPNDSVKPFFNKSNWLVSIFAATVSIAAAPFFTIRKSHVVPSSLGIYLHQVTFFAVAVGVVILLLLWVMQFRPYFEVKSGHYYIGKFEIKNKHQVLGYCFLSLLPGKRNWIKVSQKVFYSVKIGEIIELKRATFGGIESIKKASSVRQRVKDHYYKRLFRRQSGSQ
jgi:magnesium-transporting ATPase (P-type)